MIARIAHQALSIGFQHFIRDRARQPHPDRENCFATEFTSADGTQLKGWAYRPSNHTAGTLFLQHGLCCHSLFMADLAFRLADRFGMVAACFDSRHHGLSGDALPTFGYWEGRDIEAAINEAERYNSPRPYIVIGDSLNGLAAQWIATNDPRVDAAIMLESPGWPWDAVGKFLYGVADGFNLSKLPLIEKLGGLGKAIEVAYDDHVLTKGQLLGTRIAPPQTPLVMYLIGDQDQYDWRCAQRVYDHWYEGECGGWNKVPEPSDGHRKWFHLIEGAQHADGKTDTYSIHGWHRYHEVIEAFISTVLARRRPSSTPMDNNPITQFKDLVWQDDFDGSSLDNSKWECEVNAHGGGNNELQIYTDQPSNVRVENGCLILEAHRQVTTLLGSTRDYSSGRIRTKHRGDWLYGRFEVKAKLPKGQGIWPAIWMLPTDEKYGGWAASGEIDIMELLGHEPNKVMGTIHYGGAWPKNTSDGSQHFQLPAGDFSDDFHVFRLDWTETGMKWFVDDVLFRETPPSQWFSASAPSPAPFDQRFHLILNLAVGGNWPGSPAPSTRFPCRMEVDWIRIYQ
jgi:beta-glucanase (GH16 family)